MFNIYGQLVQFFKKLANFFLSIFSFNWIKFNLNFLFDFLEGADTWLCVFSLKALTISWFVMTSVEILFMKYFQDNQPIVSYIFTRYYCWKTGCIQFCNTINYTWNVIWSCGKFLMLEIFMKNIFDVATSL